MAYRVRLALSPDFENDLFLGQNIEQIFGCLSGAISLLKKFRNISLLVIPFEYKQYFHSQKKLKPLLDQISVPQSNILFESPKQKDFCKESDSQGMFQGTPSSFASRKIVNLLSQRNSPIILGTSKQTVVKNLCSTCASLQACSKVFSSDTLILPNEESLFPSMCKNSASQSLDLYKTISGPANRFDLHQIIHTTAISNGVALNEIIQPNTFSLTDSFISDLKDSSWDDLFTIAYCVYRSVAYPSTRDAANRVSNSIDWHKNTLEECNGYKLFRCDVVGANKTGITGSGVERILFAVIGGKKHFIAYTNSHDFSDALIKSRTLELKSSLK